MFRENDWHDVKDTRYFSEFFVSFSIASTLVWPKFLLKFTQESQKKGELVSPVYSQHQMPKDRLKSNTDFIKK